MSSTVDKLYCTRKAGTGVFAHNVPIAASNIQGLPIGLLITGSI